MYEKCSVLAETLRRKVKMISPVTIGFLVIIVSSAYGVVIQCDYKTQNFGLSTVANSYSCVVIMISAENPTIVDDIIGNHTVGMDNSHVRGFFNFRCAHCPISVPKNIGHFFPNLVAFRWGSSNLEVLTADALETLPNLLSLELAGNSLTSLDGNLFQYTRRLYFVDFTSNKIQHIGFDLLTGMNELTVIAFRNNICIDIHLAGRNNIIAANVQLPISCPPSASTSAQSTVPTATVPTSTVPTTTVPTTTVPTTTVPTSTVPSTTLTSTDPTTPVSEQCRARCSVNKEIDELKVQLYNLSLLNAKFEERFECQHRRIEALEVQLRGGQTNGKYIMGSISQYFASLN